MPKAKKKDDAAALPDPLPPPEADDAESLDKTQAVLAELKLKSSEIVIRQSFTKANPNTTLGISALLDEVVGADGWSVAYKTFGNDAVMCELIVKVAGQFISKCGIGHPSGNGTGTERMKSAVMDSLFAAAAEWGIKRASRAMAENGLVPPDAKKPATPPVSPVTPKPEPKAEPAKSKQEVVAERVGWWVQALAACDTPDAVNALLPKLKDEESFAKKDVWDLIQRTCKDPDIGWLYDATKMKFYDPNADAPKDGVGEAIPF